MIKINLLPVKKKKRAKPLPGFFLTAIAVFAISAAVTIYVIYFFNSRLASRKATIAENEKTIEELSKKIKAVENYEKLNATFQKHKQIIEELGKNKTLPVKALDEISVLLPPGIWFNSLDIKGQDLNVNGTGFTNSDVVNYVNNLKKSAMFTDVYLQESIQNQASGLPVYVFKLTFKVKKV